MACHSPTFKASRLITLLTPGMGSSQAVRPGLHRPISAPSLCYPAPTSCLHRPFYALRKLRVCNPSGCFALDGSSALAFLAR